MELLYSDRRILVCVKPAGVRSTNEPGGLPSLLREQLGDSTACIRTIHRLDQVVGGVMVLARSRKAAQLLSEEVRSHSMRKEYLAVLCGTLPARSGTLQDLLLRDKTTRTTRVVSAPGKDVREAILDYSVLREAAGYTLVRVTLHTGRTHQIRCQFAARGCPLAGDRKYGAPERPAEEPQVGIGLWSHQLSFRHPQTGERMTFSADPPQRWPWTLFSP